MAKRFKARSARGGDLTVRRVEGSPVASAPPLQEVSTVDSYLYFTRPYPFNSDEVVGKKGLKKYTEIYRDEQVKSAILSKQFAVIGPGWEIVPASYEKESEDESAKEIAGFVQQCFDDMDGAFENKLLEMLSAYIYGFSVAEKVWYAIDKGQFSGKVGLKDLKFRNPIGFDFQMDPFGNLLPNGVLQATRPLPADKFLIYSYRKRFSNLYGDSDLREVYRAWWAKDNAIKFMMITLERYGEPTWVFNVKGATARGNVISLESFMRDIQSKSGLILPDNITAEPKFPGDAAAGNYIPILDYLDGLIRAALGMPSLIGASTTEAATGSLARANTQYDMFMNLMRYLRSDAESNINEQVVKQLVDYNYEIVDGKYPKFKFKDIDPQEEQARFDNYLKGIVQKGFTKTREDETYFRMKMDLPALPDDYPVAGEVTPEMQAELDAQAELMRDAQVQALTKPKPAESEPEDEDEDNDEDDEEDTQTSAKTFETDSDRHAREYAEYRNKQALQNHLINNDRNRDLMGPEAVHVQTLMPKTISMQYLDVPGVDQMHKDMGIEPDLDTDVKKYVTAKAKLFSKQPQRRVDIGSMTFTQTHVHKSRVEDMSHDIEALNNSVQVLKSGNAHYLMDGHHRVVARHKAGKQFATANVYDAIVPLRSNHAEWDESEHPRHEKGSDKGGEFAPKSNVDSPEDSSFGPFGEWAADLRSDKIVGYRSDQNGGANLGLMAATEGDGIYIAKERETANFFGASRRIKFDIPKKPLIVKNEPLHILNETDEIMQPPNKSDSPWLSANKEAVKRSKTNDANWGEKTKGELQTALTDVIRERGYDSVYVSSGGEDWVVLIPPKGKRINLEDAELESAKRKSFHLPGEHEQESHGNRDGGQDNESSEDIFDVIDIGDEEGDFSAISANFQKWRQSLSAAERSALTFYRDKSGFERINDYLRGGFYDRRTRAQALSIEQALDRASLPNGQTVYRGVRASFDAKVGETISEDGFMSASPSSTVAANFVQGEKNSTLFKLTIKGVKGAYIADKGKLPEVIIQRLSSIKVLSKRTLSDGIMYIEGELHTPTRDFLDLSDEISAYHLPGEHDQEDHGNWADDTPVDPGHEGRPGKRGGSLPRDAGKKKARIVGEAGSLANLDKLGVERDDLIEGFSIDGFSTEITAFASLAKKTIDIEGAFYDDKENKVGEFIREIDLGDKFAVHWGFSIEKEYQGKGIAKQALKSQMELYDKLGIKSIHTTANGRVGKYAWALYGFNWANKEIRDEKVGMFVEYLKNGNASQAVIDKASAIKHSWEMAMFKVGDKKAGKDFMLNRSGEWKAMLETKDGPGRWIFNYYVGAK